MWPTTLLLLTHFARADLDIRAPPFDLIPRFYYGTSPTILERQSTGLCAANEHSCLDLNGTGLLTTGKCCSNDDYCMLDNSFNPVCCPIGSNCGLPCASSEYQCKGTAISTFTFALASTTSGTATVQTTVSTSITASCCARRCPATSVYLCPSALGGGCCAFDSACVSGGGCSLIVDPTTSSAASCPTAQSVCAVEQGGGCCSVGWGCTAISSTNYCASASESAFRTGPNNSQSTDILPSSSRKGGLSSAAKAGIGGGIAVLALAIIGGVIYFCIMQRRRARTVVEESESDNVLAVSQVSGPGRPNPVRRQTADYFGPDAKTGPYTDTYSPEGSPGLQRGVPVSPHSPGDIALPVEIDSISHSSVTTPNGFGHLKKSPTVTEYPIEVP